MSKTINKDGIIVYSLNEEERIDLENRDIMDILFLSLNEKQRKLLIKRIGLERYKERLIIAQNKFKTCM